MREMFSDRGCGVLSFGSCNSSMNVSSDEVFDIVVLSKNTVKVLVFLSCLSNGSYLSRLRITSEVELLPPYN